MFTSRIKQLNKFSEFNSGMQSSLSDKARNHGLTCVVCIIYKVAAKCQPNISVISLLVSVSGVHISTSLRTC